MVRLGIIGCGKITQRACLPNLAHHPDVKIEILCDINKKAALGHKQKFNLKDSIIETDWIRTVESDKIDAVYVATPNYLHAQMCILAAENKKHVLVEKPMTLSVEDADDMINAANRNNVYLMVEQSHRFDPVHITAKKVIDSKVLGDVNFIRARIGHAGPEYWSKTSTWFYDKKKSGGGVIIDIGVHILDLLRWFMGKKISALCANIQTMEKKVGLDDNANVLLRFADGSMGEFECSWTTRPYEVKTTLYGKNGKLITSIGDKDPVVVLHADRRKGKDPNVAIKIETPHVLKGGAWTNAMNYFVSCVKNKKRPFVDGNEGRETMKVILACYESARRKGWVKVQ